MLQVSQRLELLPCLWILLKDSGLVGKDKELERVPDWGSIFERGLCWHPQRQSSVHFPEKALLFLKDTNDKDASVDPGGPELDCSLSLQKCLPGKLVLSLTVLLVCALGLLVSLGCEGREGWGTTLVGGHVTPVNGMLFTTIVSFQGAGDVWI